MIISKEDKELFDIVNSHSTGGSSVITTKQIKNFINNDKSSEGFNNVNDDINSNNINISLQRKSIVGTVSYKKNGIAKIIIIAGVAVAVIGSLSMIIFNFPYDKDLVPNVNDISESSVVSVSDISALDDSFLGYTNETSKDENIIVVETSQDEKDTSSFENSEDSTYDELEFNINDSIEVEENEINNINEDLDDTVNNYSESDNIEDSIDFENLNSNDNEVIFYVGTSSDIDDTRSFLDNTIEGYLIKFYSKMYGIDSSIVAAICYQESGGVNIVDGGAAVGIMMLENMGNYDITVYNYNDNCWETLTVSSSNTDNLEYNIRCGVANIQNKLNYFNGNIYAALQAYNYSEYTMQNALDYNGYKLNGVNDYGWLYITEDVTNNPQKYGISALDENGDEIYTKYGVSYYPKYTGYHLIEDIINYKYIDNDKIYDVKMNYSTAKVLSINEYDMNNYVR